MSLRKLTPSMLWSLLRTSVTSWLDDYAPSMGAALAYYTLFSIAPLLLIVVSVAGLVFGMDAARGEISEQLQGLMGEQGARAVEGLLERVNQPAAGMVSTVIGAAFLLVGATTVFAELQDALDRIWDVPRQRDGGLWGLLHTRLLSFGMILGIGFLLMVSLVLSALLSALGKFWGAAFGDWLPIVRVLELVISYLLVTTVFALIYKIMPRARVAWTDVGIGAAFTAALFTVGKYLIGLYIGQSSVTSVFGAAGSVVVMLVWVYYSAQIFLLGAEFTWVYAQRLGSRAPPESSDPPAPACLRS